MMERDRKCKMCGYKGTSDEIEVDSWYHVSRCVNKKQCFKRTKIAAREWVKKIHGAEFAKKVYSRR